MFAFFQRRRRKKYARKFEASRNYKKLTLAYANTCTTYQIYQQNRIILYKSIHTYFWSILESTLGKVENHCLTYKCVKENCYPSLIIGTWSVCWKYVWIDLLLHLSKTMILIFIKPRPPKHFLDKNVVENEQCFFMQFSFFCIWYIIMGHIFCNCQCKTFFSFTDATYSSVQEAVFIWKIFHSNYTHSWFNSRHIYFTLEHIRIHVYISLSPCKIQFKYKVITINYLKNV